MGYILAGSLLFAPDPSGIPGGSRTDPTLYSEEPAALTSDQLLDARKKTSTQALRTEVVIDVLSHVLQLCQVSFDQDAVERDRKRRERPARMCTSP